MKCRQAQELMGPYLYGDLNADEMRELRVHTQDCTLCREDLATRGRVVSALDDSTPTLSDADRQRIAWSVKGAVLKKQVRSRPLIFRLAPALGLAAVVLAAGFMAGKVANRHSHQTAQKSNPQLPTAKIEVKETTAQDSKKDKIPDQMMEAIRSLITATAPTAEVNRQTGSGRGQIIIRQPGFQDKGVKMAPDSRRKSSTAQQPVAAETPKDSTDGVKKSETVAGSGDKLPRVTDPKNAQTAPSEP